VKKLTLVTNLFYPDQLGGAALYTDMAAYFRESGWSVHVVTTFPYYPQWKTSNDDKNCFCREDRVGGNKVTRLKMYVPAKQSGLRRIFSELSFLCSLLLDEAMNPKRGDVFITACPMLSQCCFSFLMNLRRRAPVMIIVQDFVVGAATNLGLWGNKKIYRRLEILESWCLRSANVLTSIEPCLVSRLRPIAKGDPELSVAFVPNWIHGSLEQVIRQVRETNLIPRFLDRLFYSGNIGAKQGLEDFVTLFKDDEFGCWKLEIRGAGAAIEKVSEVAHNCSRIGFGQVQEEEEYISNLMACTACLITQKSGAGDDFFPSKLLPALATGTPVLAICDPQSPLANFVRDGQFGVSVAMDKQELLSVLNSWEKDPQILQTFSVNALKVAKQFSREEVLGKYSKILESLIKGTKDILL
jgi:colanic acid biosynthesis glycosyl transferase WcaI